jgi:NAD(P)-dependent dehydrogenase (short-subunit alcohol dehydrogenase family)
MAKMPEHRHHPSPRYIADAAPILAWPGRHVNVSSALGGVFTGSVLGRKGGINAITASLALEYADAGIRVVATAPGGTQAPPRRIARGTPEPTTDTERAWLQDHSDQTIGSSLMKRYGTLDEQAAAICFLASDEASYIAGTVLPVAGGDQGDACAQGFEPNDPGFCPIYEALVDTRHARPISPAGPGSGRMPAATASSCAIRTRC